MEICYDNYEIGGYVMHGFELRDHLRLMWHVDSKFLDFEVSGLVHVHECYLLSTEGILDVVGQSTAKLA